MKSLFKILFFLSLVFSFSCEEQGLIINCKDCVKDEPLNVDLIIRYGINNFGATTEIIVYEGNIEDGVIYKVLRGAGTETKIKVTLNKKYTVTAAYYVPDNNYLAVDSATPRVKYNKDQCDEPCYFMYDRVVNLRLKYTK